MKLIRNFVKIFNTIFFCNQCFKILVKYFTGKIRSVKDILKIIHSKMSWGILGGSLLLSNITYFWCAYFFFLFTKSSGFFLSIRVKQSLLTIEERLVDNFSINNVAFIWDSTLQWNYCVENKRHTSIYNN